MNFDYSEEQELLADSLRRYLQRDYDFEKRKQIVGSKQGWSEQVWAQLAALGLTGLPLSPDYGGFGGGAVDLMGVMEAFGDALVVEPFVPTMLAARLVAKSALPGKGELLSAVAEGKARLAFAHAEKGARHRLDQVKVKASQAGGAWTLQGRKPAVAGAAAAARLVVSARGPDGIGLFLVDATQLKIKPYRLLDETVAADIALRGTPAEPLGLGQEAIEDAVDFGTALICAEAVGAMKSASDATLEYLKTRKQFGVPIGAFQALQHRMVDMFIACEQARSMACLACSTVDSCRDPRERARAVSAAKIKIADGARHVSQEAVQLHGGMGMTDELDVSHYFKRLLAFELRCGTTDPHLESYRRQLRAA